MQNVVNFQAVNHNKERVEINPYRLAAWLIKNRLSWDLQINSWRSRKKLQQYKDIYKGKKAVIICNGPSLLKVNLGLLENVYTFGLNKINLLFDKNAFRPDCIVAVNQFVLEQNVDFYRNTNIPLFLDSSSSRQIGNRKNITYLHSTETTKLAADCSFSINQGFTVTTVALQLAFHMGFTSVALIGCDHTFATKGPANKTVVSGSKDESHFDPRYFSGGMKWQLPDLAASEYFYTKAREMYISAGRKIYNCTEGGLLEVFERKPLGEYLLPSVV